VGSADDTIDRDRHLRGHERRDDLGHRGHHRSRHLLDTVMLAGETIQSTGIRVDVDRFIWAVPDSQTRAYEVDPMALTSDQFKAARRRVRVLGPEARGDRQRAGNSPAGGSAGFGGPRTRREKSKIPTGLRTKI
jgi:hypothetical protein